MNFPVPTSQQELLDLLDRIREGVATGDTLEGFVEFTLPYPPAGDPEDADFMVISRYRVGNQMGQGGLSSHGSWNDEGNGYRAQRDEQLKRQQDEITRLRERLAEREA